MARYEQTHFDVFRKSDGSGREMVAYTQGEMTMSEETEPSTCARCRHAYELHTSPQEHTIKSGPDQGKVIHSDNGCSVCPCDGYVIARYQIQL